SRQGLREIVERHRSDVVRLEVENAEVVLDLNRPEEYQQAMEEAGFSNKVIENRFDHPPAPLPGQEGG
ncbi:MAG: hypothetical protein Q7K03_10060, partial [Dehalococcoidia bacterium]|nr:hypothetical protein [Dehalococcoidia bacterium]